MVKIEERTYDKPPKDYQSFIEQQAQIHVEKDTDYGSRFMKGLIEHGRPIWVWEVEKKLDRVRTWLDRGTLEVKGEGVTNAVGDLFNYTVQYSIWFICTRTGHKENPLDCLSKEDFKKAALSNMPAQWVALLVSEGLVSNKEKALQNILRLYMGDNPKAGDWITRNKGNS